LNSNEGVIDIHQVILKGNDCYCKSAHGVGFADWGVGTDRTLSD